MAVKPGLHVSQHQRLGLTPALRMSFSLLRLAGPDLTEAIEREAADNPFLVVEDVRRGSRSSWDGADALELVAHEPSLVERLRHQIAALPVGREVSAMAEYLAGQLRDDGYLDGTTAEIAGVLGLSEALVIQGLEALQLCEPAGIGARDLGECLALQLADRGVEPGLARSVLAHLDLLAAGRLGTLATRLGIPAAQVARIAELLPELTPRPIVDSAPLAPVLQPDLILEAQGGGGFRASLGQRPGDAVRIDTALLATAAASADAGGFVASRRERAEALMRALAFRGETLLRIGNAIAVAQHRFFALGPDHLVPMSRAALATELGLHPSTVGRAVAGKAISVAGRLHPLAAFFSNALPAANDRSVAAFVVRRSIARVIAAEARGAPVTDDALCRRLRDEGVDIARRTVAKYRQQMRIPPAHQRRRGAAGRGAVPPGSA